MTQKLFSEAARIMIKKLNERTIQIQQEHHEDHKEDDDTLAAGMRALIGTSIIDRHIHHCYWRISLF